MHATGERTINGIHGNPLTPRWADPLWHRGEGKRYRFGGWRQDHSVILLDNAGIPTGRSVRPDSLILMQ